MKLLEAAAKDEFCRPLIVCGLSTAMRLGDCCTLKWADVDMTSATPSVTVKTSKTGETVCIPIYERLRGELEIARSRRNGTEEYVWPEQAALHKRQHYLVSRKLGRIFAKAVGKDNVHVERKHGMYDGSVIGFHSLRTTWITEALSRGVPIETVKLISGHKTVEVVTTHYFHPSQEHVRNSLDGLLPEEITGQAAPLALLPGPVAADKGPSELLEAAVTALEALPVPGGKAGKTWKKGRDRAVTLVRQAKEWVDGATA